MFFLFRWLAISVAILLVPYLISGVTVRDFGSALVAAAVLGVLNTFLKPVLVLLTLPLTFFTLGFFLLVINAVLFQFAGSLVAGIHIASFWSALGASLIVSLVSSFVSGLGDNHLVFRMRRSGPVPGRTRGTLDMHRTDDGKWE